MLLTSVCWVNVIYQKLLWSVVTAFSQLICQFRGLSFVMSCKYLIHLSNLLQQFGNSLENTEFLVSETVGGHHSRNGNRCKRM